MGSAYPLKKFLVVGICETVAMDGFHFSAPTAVEYALLNAERYYSDK